MVDLIVRIAAIVAGAALLLVLNTWFIRLAWGVFEQRALPSTIAPVQISGGDDKDNKAGQLLASMLLGRLSRISGEMAAVVEQLKQPLAEIESIRPQDLGSTALRGDLGLPSEVFEPLQLDMKVAGVEVGGLLNWLHRALVSENSLRLALENANGRAVVVGTWNDGRSALWLEIKGDAADKPLPNERIATAVAYAITQRQMAQKVAEVSALEVAEFQTLLDLLTRAAELHQKAVLGRAAGREYAELSDGMEKLLEKTPRWKELMHFAARLAELGGRLDVAVKRYEVLAGLHEKDSQPRAEAQASLARLNEKLLATVAAAVSPMPPPQTAGAAPAASSPSVSTALPLAWPLAQMGIADLLMARPIKVAVIGGPPVPGTLRADQMQMVGGGVAEPHDEDSGRYVQSVVRVVTMAAPLATFVFAKSGLTSGGIDTGALLLEVQQLIASQPDVLLVTLGPLRGEALGRMLEGAVKGGAILVLPAGNAGEKEAVPSLGPLLDTQALVVGATNRKGEIALFSQRGKQVLWAPGEDIGLEVNGKRSNLQSGTSFSAAFAAGLAARLLAAHPKADRQGLRALLAETARPVVANGVPVLNYPAASARLGSGG